MPFVQEFAPIHMAIMQKFGSWWLKVFLTSLFTCLQ